MSGAIDSILSPNVTSTGSPVAVFVPKQFIAAPIYSQLCHMHCSLSEGRNSSKNLLKIPIPPVIAPAHKREAR
jgi:hypothetical protein